MPKFKITAALVERYARYIIIILSAVAAVDNMYKKDWVTVASAVLTIIFLIVPWIFEKLARISLPVSFRIVYLIFIIASMYLGEIHSFFYRLVWWDIFLHTASAMMLAYVGLILVFILNHKVNPDFRLSPLFMAIFAFCFPVSIGGVWELFELGVDKVFGVNMIKAIDPNDVTRFYDYGRGFLNTMHDLAMDMTGALLVSTAIYIFLRRRGGSEKVFAMFRRQFVKST